MKKGTIKINKVPDCNFYEYEFLYMNNLFDENKVSLCDFKLDN